MAVSICFVWGEEREGGYGKIRVFPSNYIVIKHNKMIISLKYIHPGIYLLLDLKDRNNLPEGNHKSTSIIKVCYSVAKERSKYFKTF